MLGFKTVYNQSRGDIGFRDLQSVEDLSFGNI